MTSSQPAIIQEIFSARQIAAVLSEEGREILRDLTLVIRRADMDIAGERNVDAKWAKTIKGGLLRGQYRSTWESYRKCMAVLHSGRIHGSVIKNFA